MNALLLKDIKSLDTLITMVEQSPEPLIVGDEKQERVVAMTPEVLERLLFDSNLLNLEGHLTYKGYSLDNK